MGLFTCEPDFVHFVYQVTWMGSPTRWTWVLASSRNWWWTGKAGVLQSVALQSQTPLSNWTELIGCQDLDSNSMVGLTWSLLICKGSLIRELMIKTKEFSEHAWTQPSEWEIDVPGMGTCLSLGQASWAQLPDCGTNTPYAFYYREALRAWEKESVCFHPCCQCIVLCSLTKVVVLLLERRYITEVNKVSVEPYFLFIFYFPLAVGFPYIPVAFQRVSHNSMVFPKFELPFQWE